MLTSGQSLIRREPPAMPAWRRQAGTLIAYLLPPTPIVRGRHRQPTRYVGPQAGAVPPGDAHGDHFMSIID